MIPLEIQREFLEAAAATLMDPARTPLAGPPDRIKSEEVLDRLPWSDDQARRYLANPNDSVVGALWARGLVEWDRASGTATSGDTRRRGMSYSFWLTPAGLRAAGY